ncbi:unnamed protein product [Rotaria magnacalcarata]|nr:unnamed protein product [Rotaria magnacalcarata]CAF1449548.1 unnamed protein product [Rotaria magnacalcarata]
MEPTTKKWYQQIEELTDEGFIFTESELGQNSNSDSLLDLMILERAPNLFTLDGSRRVHLHIVRRHLNDNDQQQDDGATYDTLCIEDIIIITVRHESIDYTSMKFLMDELSDAYRNGHLENQPDAVSYLDYTLYERRNDRSVGFNYWQEHQRNLNTADFLSHIPCDQPWIAHPPAVVPAHSIVSRVDKNITQTMLQCADACNTTLATICLASFCAFIYDMTNYWHDDIGITYTMASRPTEPEAGGLIGPFMYLKLLRMHLENGPHTTFLKLVHWVRSAVMEGFKHVRATHDPFDTNIHDALSPSSLSPEMCPCVAVQFDLEENNHLILDEAGDARLDILRNEDDGFPLDMWWRVASNDYWITLFNYNPEAEELRCVSIFPATLFERPTAEKLGARFRMVLEQLFGNETTDDDRQLQPLSTWIHNNT